MMELEEAFDNSLRAHVAREQKWWKQDRRGRWVVLEPGPGRLLKGSPQHIRDHVDAITSQRGRRFSSLSRARKFAKAIGGEVRRWRRQMPRRGPWRRETNPWQHALRSLLFWDPPRHAVEFTAHEVDHEVSDPGA